MAFVRSLGDLRRAQYRDARALILASWFSLLTPACATGSAGSAHSPSGRARLLDAAPELTSAVDSGAAARNSVLERPAYVRAVLLQNPTLESARQGVRAATSRIQQAGVWEDPMLELSLAPLSVGRSEARVGYEVGISQRVPWVGKRPLEVAAAAAEASASRSDFEALRRELALTAAILYDQYFVAVRAVAINQRHVELLHAMRDAALTQFEAGRASAQDPLRAESELAHLEHDGAILASQRDITVAQMNELLHRAPDSTLPPPPEELPLPVAPSLKEAAALESHALGQRSEIAAARQRADAAGARAEGAEREAYPDLTVSTSYNSMWDMPEHRWMVGIGLSVPIQSGRRVGRAEEARAMRLQYESDAVRLADATRTQVFVAVKRLSESRHVTELFETRLLPIAKQQLEAARAGFIASQSSFMELMEAERNLRSVELERERARAEFDQRSAELDRALGRFPGFDAPEARR